MTTSRTTLLAKPAARARISAGTLSYVRARNRQRAYDLVIRQLKKSGITQAELSRRLGKGQDAISRLLSRPSNWELDTLSDLLFAISGTVPKFDAEHPASKQNLPINLTPDPASESDSNLPHSPKAKSNNPEVY